MKRLIQNLHYPVILFVCIFFCSSCTLISSKISKTSKRLRPPSETDATVSILKHQNHKLTTFKGLGRIVFLGSGGKDVSTRIAWVASVPDRLRITLSDITGQPIISAASDGHWLYLISYAKREFFKKRATSSNMKQFFSVSIKSQDVVNILAGRVPFGKYDSAVLVEDGSLNRLTGEGSDTAGTSSSVGNDHGNTLILKDKWGNVIEKVYLNPINDVQKLEKFNSTGDLLYRVEFHGLRQISGYRIPFRLKVSNAEGQGFKLDLDRYWADARVSPAIFTLAPPK
jgi:hypothetical protein